MSTREFIDSPEVRCLVPRQWVLLEIAARSSNCWTFYMSVVAMPVLRLSFLVPTIPHLVRPLHVIAITGYWSSIAYPRLRTLSAPATLTAISAAMELQS